jgi:hypothetical protein
MGVADSRKMTCATGKPRLYRMIFGIPGPPWGRTWMVVSGGGSHILEW